MQILTLKQESSFVLSHLVSSRVKIIENQLKLQLRPQGIVES